MSSGGEFSEKRERGPKLVGCVRGSRYEGELCWEVKKRGDLQVPPSMLRCSLCVCIVASTGEVWWW